MGEKSIPENGIESDIYHKMLIFIAGMHRLFIPCRQLPYCLPVGNVLINRDALPPTTQIQHVTTMTIMKSSITSHDIDASKNKFHNGIDFSQGIDSVEAMPGVNKSLQIQAQDFK
jgi:hypothetical protein